MAPDPLPTDLPTALAEIERLRARVAALTAERDELVADLSAVRADRDQLVRRVGSSRVDLQACKLEYSIVSPK